MKKTALSLLVVLIIGSSLTGDEGMWPLNRLPAANWRDRYGIEPDAAWVGEVQKACLKVSTGGSASFVSSKGLIMTNHHVGLRAVADLSTPETDYTRVGFHASNREAELPCPRLEMYQLVSMEDVTATVTAGVKPGMSPGEQHAVAEEVIGAITREAEGRTGLYPEVVKLYRGARYYLYLYKVYDDVRLVMAPESGIAFFGGDLHNFGYPRYNLDVCFFRAYEGGVPADTPRHFRWSEGGAKEGDVVFVAGHPFRTRRMYTVAHLHFLRDMELSLILDAYNQLEVALAQFVQRSGEHRRIGTPRLRSVQNGRKAYNGILSGLLDRRLMLQKQKGEGVLRGWIQGDEERRERFGDPWQELELGIAAMQKYYPVHFLLENRRSPMGELYPIAKLIVRAAVERGLAEAKRHEAFRGAELEKTEDRIFSESPVYAELEERILADGLLRLARVLGGDHPIVITALAGKTPEARAAEVIAGTRLADLEERKALYDGGMAAIRASNDPLIKMAASLETFARSVRDRFEGEFGSIETSAYARIARAGFEFHEGDLYPDATSTLRLSIGTVSGYEERGRAVPAMTLLEDVFRVAAEHGGAAPFDLPETWLESRERLDPAVPFNFVSTNDITGGNSGSPVFSEAREIVGVVFDGNIQSLVWDIVFDQERARAISVHSRAIIEALKTVYRADGLVEELLKR